MSDVSIIGTGMVRFGRSPDKGLVDIAWPAVKEAVKESGVSREDIGAAFCGTMGSDGIMLGQRILKVLGMTGMTVVNCEGAAAIALAADDVARKYCDKPVKIVASVQNSGRYYTGFRDMTVPEITVRTGKEIYEKAGLGPEDIDLVEMHDAFTINEFLYSDALGFSKPGEAVKLLEDGETTIGGRIPMNPTGGLLSRGHPIGPTGAAQMVEVARQLQGRRGKLQVEGARIGMTHVTGGGGGGLDHGTCTMHILAV